MSQRPVPRPEASGNGAIENLPGTLELLARAEHMNRVIEIVRHAARRLTGADGASFILREQSNCYYVDEEAISPLWKGRRFPMEKCVSGWAMANVQPVMIENIYADPRVPWEAYHPTFVKSLAIVPIGRERAVGAIGTYWAMRHAATEGEMKTIVALADGAAATMNRLGCRSD